MADRRLLPGWIYNRTTNVPVVFTASSILTYLQWVTAYFRYKHLRTILKYRYAIHLIFLFGSVFRPSGTAVLFGSPVQFCKIKNPHYVNKNDTIDRL